MKLGRLVGISVLLGGLLCPGLALANLEQITRLEVNLTKRQVVAFEGDQKVKTYSIGVGKKAGKPRWEPIELWISKKILLGKIPSLVT